MESASRRGLTTIALMVLIIGVIILLSVIAPALTRLIDPAARAAHDASVRQAQERSQELEPFLRLLLKALIISVIACCIAVTGCVVGWVMTKTSTWRLRSRLIPTFEGMLPMVYGAAGHQIWVPPYQPNTMVMAALTGGRGNVTRFPASALRTIGQPDEVPVEDQPPLALPARASIYTAPLDRTLSLPIGQSADGPISLPLRDLGGGIIGGLQGLGKSELVASMIVGLLRQDPTGKSVALAMADMKGGLDFGRMTPDLNALQWPIATNEGAATALVGQLWQEIQRRQNLLQNAGVASMENYNASRAGDSLPYIVAFVDELMLLTAPSLETGTRSAERTASQEFISLAVKCLAIGRATGVSLIMATQRPSGDVVPTRLRDLAGFRVAYRCATVEASRAVLGQSGAEMLPFDPGQALLVRGESPVRIRTYEAGIRAGQFDQFLSKLPRSPRLELPADAEANGLRDTGCTGKTAYTANGNMVFTASNGLPLRTAVYIPPDVTSLDITQEMRRAIWRAWIMSGSSNPNRKPSLRGTQAILWPDLQHGGAKFYLVREVVQEEMHKRGLSLQGEVCD